MLSRFVARNLLKPARFFSDKVLTIPLPASDFYKLEEQGWPELPKETTVTHEELKYMLKEMMTMRRMEIVCDNLYKNKEIRGFCHLYDGQEAVAMGIELACTFDDAIITAYRDHCQAYLRGISVFQIFCEMLGKEGGSSKCKGGSMHYYSPKNNFYGGNGIVGAQIPIGAGLAFALKYKKKPNIAISMYGDGAANQGQLYEASNMAQLWNLPVVFLCENNRYGMGTSIERASNETRLHRRLGNVPGMDLDGLNVFAVKNVIDYCKVNCLVNGPITLNVHTYRYHGHSMSDPGITYRTREEVSFMRKEKDCIEYIKRVLTENNVMTAPEIKDMEKEVKKGVDADAKRAQEQDVISLDVL
jgi:pyruvate dehydrogenase E1 component alpha subunit